MICGCDAFGMARSEQQSVPFTWRSLTPRDTHESVPPGKMRSSTSVHSSVLGPSGTGYLTELPSASPAKQPFGMRRLLDDAEDRDLVVMWRISRLGRSVLEVLATVILPRKRGSGCPTIEAPGVVACASARPRGGGSDPLDALPDILRAATEHSVYRLWPGRRGMRAEELLSAWYR
ncbi:MAG: recombinase family protein [Brevibacterium sp.]